MEKRLLENIVSLRRAKTRLAILDFLLKKGEALKVAEIAKNLNISSGAASVALHYLTEDGLVVRVKRGYYKANSPRILRALLPLITSDLFLDLLEEYREKIKGKVAHTKVESKEKE